MASTILTDFHHENTWKYFWRIKWFENSKFLRTTFWNCVPFSFSEDFIKIHDNIFLSKELQFSKSSKYEGSVLS